MRQLVQQIPKVLQQLNLNNGNRLVLQVLNEATHEEFH
jgi:antitoxin component of MazEF toxin-antitoxin module